MTYPNFDALDPRRGLLWLPMVSQYDVGGVRVTPNLSLVAGAVNAILGNGSTAGTFPSQRAGGRGLTFDGAQYVNLDWAAGGPLDTQTFTFICYAQVRPQDLKAFTILLDIGSGTDRYDLYWEVSTGALTFNRVGGLSAFSLTSTRAFPDGGAHVYAVSIDSAACKLHVDGEVVASAVGDFRLSSYGASPNASIGSYIPAVGSYGVKGTIYQAAIYPFALNPAQIREVGRRMKQMRNV